MSCYPSWNMFPNNQQRTGGRAGEMESLGAGNLMKLRQFHYIINHYYIINYILIVLLVYNSIPLISKCV
jgi:hypothetical protein